MNKHYIAVYGTLKSGYHNHDYLASAKFVKHSHTGPGYALFVDRLPYLVKREDGAGCSLEIYEVNDETLFNLDRLEGHPHFYTRELLRFDEDLKIELYVLSKEDSVPFLKKNISKAKPSYEG